MEQLGFRLDGRVALITGGAQSIGRGIAAACGQAGARVALLDRNARTLNATAGDLRGDGIEVLELHADLLDLEAAAQAVDDTVEQWGRLDILVNNAGTCRYSYFLDVTEEEYDLIMDVNLKGAFFISQAAARQMARRGEGGKIVSIASAMALVGGEKRAVYCASKGGLLQLTRTMAIELAEHNIQVNCVAPTFIRTPLNEEAFADPDFHGEIIRRIPAHHVGRVEDVAGAVVYLASPAADFVTGHCLCVDGGYVAW